MITAFVIYACTILLIVFLSYKKHTTETDFVLGSRQINFWVTAISAHASDMSAWLFMAVPSLVFVKGPSGAWIAVGLIVGMFLNWQFIAPKLRVLTEKYGSLTLSSYLESRYDDRTGFIRIATGLISVLFYTFYISAGMVAFGVIFQNVFSIPYEWGVSIGAFIIVLYTVFGGYITVAWTDLFQGCFLLIMIFITPIVAFFKLGGASAIKSGAIAKSVSLSIIPDTSVCTWLSIAFLILGWGPGYFGQLHILTKFMGIKNPKEIYKSKYLGISWQILAMAGAIFVGLTAFAFFKTEPLNSELIFVYMSKALFYPFFAGLVLCAMLAATMSTAETQILVVATLLSEDFYKRIARPKAKSSELLWASRILVVLVALSSFFIAVYKVSSIYTLVMYSWSGIGAAFGPIILLSLYSKKVNRDGAVMAILVGGVTAATWQYINKPWWPEIPELVPAFILSLFSAWFFSYISRIKSRSQKTHSGG